MEDTSDCDFAPGHKVLQHSRPNNREFKSETSTQKKKSSFPSKEINIASNSRLPTWPREGFQQRREIRHHVHAVMDPRFQLHSPVVRLMRKNGC